MAGVPREHRGAGLKPAAEGKGAETREAKNTASTSGLGEGSGEQFPEKQAGTGNAGV